MRSARSILAAMLGGLADRPKPARSVRLVIEVNGRVFIDIDTKLALAMVDCAYGQPVANEYELDGLAGRPLRLKLTILEGDR